MKTIDIKLGYSCNNDCLHCVIQDFRDIVLEKGLPEDISARIYLQELENAAQRGFESVVFTGGEPAIRPELPMLLKKAHELGLKVQMQTNGRAFSSPEFTRQIVETAPVFYCVALHGPNAEIHDRITRKSGSFDETLSGLKNLLALEQELAVKIVISRFNYEFLEKTARLLFSLGVESVMLTFPHGCGNARKFFLQVVPRYRDIRPQVLKTLRLAENQKRHVVVEAVPFCFLEEYAGQGEIYLLKENENYLQQYGDEVKERNWSLERACIKRKFPVCAFCRYDLVCEGPWLEYPEHYGEEEFFPVPGVKIRSLEEFAPPGPEDLILEHLPDGVFPD